MLDAKIKTIQANCIKTIKTRIRPFNLSAVNSRLRRPLGAVVDHENGVCRCEAANRSGTVYGFVNYAVRSEDKACCMDVTSYIIKEGPCRGGECPGIKPIGNAEGQFFSFYGFLRILEAVG